MIFYKENTGMIDFQDYKLDYFKLSEDIAKRKGSVYIDVEFWRVKEDAQAEKPANLGRTIVIDKSIVDTFETLSAVGVYLFTADSLTTNEKETITLQGANPI